MDEHKKSIFGSARFVMRCIATVTVGVIAVLVLAVAPAGDPDPGAHAYDAVTESSMNTLSNTGTTAPDSINVATLTTFPAPILFYTASNPTSVEPIINNEADSIISQAPAIIEDQINSFGSSRMPFDESLLPDDDSLSHDPDELEAAVMQSTYEVRDDDIDEEPVDDEDTYNDDAGDSFDTADFVFATDFPLEAEFGLEAQCPTTSTGTYIWPAEGILTSRFGPRTSTVGSSNHKGIDIAGASGDPIYAADGGEVIVSGWLDSYGNWIKIRHDDGTETLYAHCRTRLVTVGERVSQGQQIARMGTTGQSAGVHLHFELIINGVQVNPLRYLPEQTN